jgi:hypothetical protein
MPVGTQGTNDAPGGRRWTFGGNERFKVSRGQGDRQGPAAQPLDLA